MARVTGLAVSNYRSIRGPLRIDFPAIAPLVLVGENNAGKSNIVRALSLVLGETWPGNYEPEDHEYHARVTDGDPIEITVEVDGVEHSSRYGVEHVSAFVWQFPEDDEIGKTYFMRTDAMDKNPYVSKPTREQCMCIVVGADRRLSYQLSYTSKYTFLSRLMRQFHRALIADEERVTRLREQLDVTQAIFEEVPEFSAFGRELAAGVEQLSGNLSYGLTVDFSAYDPSNFFHALRVFPNEEGDTRTFDELGTGQEQILAIAFAQAYARAFHGHGETLLLVIEEPEAHLHPLAQAWIGRQIHELAAIGGVQVVITTHSPAFLDVEQIGGVAVIRKEDAGTVVTQLSAEELAAYCREHGAATATATSILPFYAAAATQEILAGFFARKIILVEGPTEAAALPVLLQRLGLDLTKEGIAVLPVHGVGNLAKWWRLFSAYGFPVFVVFDNDSSEDADGHRRDDLLGALGVASEQRKELLETESPIVSSKFAVLGGNYEKTMRMLFGDVYSDLETEAAETLGLTREAKPLVARYAAEHLTDDLASPGWAPLAELRDAVVAL